MTRPGGRFRVAERDRGSAAVEAAILAPAILLIIALAVSAMRVEVAGEAVESSAHDAARAASISRNGSDAQAAGLAAASKTLAAQHLVCKKLSVKVSTRQFSHAAGTPASVRAKVTCVVDLSDVTVPGAPGSKTLTSTFTSVIDEYGGHS